MKLSVIIPVRNQTEKLTRNLRESILPYFDKQGITYDVLVCYDKEGESDIPGLLAALSEFPVHVKPVANEEKRGKGNGVKAGILYSDADYVLFMDADLATDLSVFDSIKPELTHYDAFMASRDLKGSIVNPKQTFIRRITHFGARMLIKMKFHFKQIKDTQCGYKLFKANIAKEMAKRQIISGFAFDVEYCYFLELNGYRIKEVACRWRNDADSTVSVNSSKSFADDLKRIKKNKKAYILTPEQKESLC